MLDEEFWSETTCFFFNINVLMKIIIFICEIDSIFFRLDLNFINENKNEI